MFFSGVWVCLNLSYAANTRHVAVYSSSHEQTHLEICTSFGNVHWHVCPQLCGIAICRIDFLQSHSRFVNPLRHAPNKASARIALRIQIFSSLGFFRKFKSIRVLLLGCHLLILLRSQILHDLHEKITTPPPHQTSGVPSVQLPELFLGLNV